MESYRVVISNSGWLKLPDVDADDFLIYCCQGAFPTTILPWLVYETRCTVGQSAWVHCIWLSNVGAMCCHFELAIVFDLHLSSPQRPSATRHTDSFLPVFSYPSAVGRIFPGTSDCR